MRTNPGRTVTIYEIPSLVKEAHMQAMTPRNIISGFQNTGIFPYNRDLFSDADFSPALLTDRELAVNPGSANHPPAPTPPAELAEDAPAQATTSVVAEPVNDTATVKVHDRQDLDHVMHQCHAHPQLMSPVLLQRNMCPLLISTPCQKHLNEKHREEVGEGKQRC